MKEIKKFLESYEKRRHKFPEHVGCSKGSLKKEFYSHEYPLQKTIALK
jgi:hypothetical protein